MIEQFKKTGNLNKLWIIKIYEKMFKSILNLLELKIYS